jgi:hypothetical protein
LFLKSLFALEAAIGIHTIAVFGSPAIYVTNGMPLGRAPPLTVGTGHSVKTQMSSENRILAHCTDDVKTLMPPQHGRNSENTALQPVHTGDYACGAMEAIYFGNAHWFGNTGDGKTGPWVGADLESGSSLFSRLFSNEYVLAVLLGLPCCWS